MEDRRLLHAVFAVVVLEVLQKTVSPLISTCARILVAAKETKSMTIAVLFPGRARLGKETVR